MIVKQDVMEGQLTESGQFVSILCVNKPMQLNLDSYEFKDDIFPLNFFFIFFIFTQNVCCGYTLGLSDTIYVLEN